MDLTHDTNKLANFSRHNAFILVVLFGTVFSAINFSLISNWEKQQIQVHFTETAFENTYRVQHQINDYLTELKAIKRFYESSNYVDRQEFHKFVSPVLNEHPEIQALEWVPKVTKAQRLQYTQKAHNTGYPQFQITEKSSNNRLIPAGIRDVYYPVYYLEPMAGNEAAFGFDLSSNDKRLNALLAARGNDNPVASEPIQLVQDKRTQKGFLIFTPVYSNTVNSGTETQRHTNLLGFVIGVFRVNDLINAAIPQHLASGINILVIDETESASPSLLHSNTSAAPPPDISHIQNVNDDTYAGQFFYDTQLPVGGRLWRLVFISGPGYISPLHLWHSWLALSITLLITGWLAQYVRSNQRQTAIIASLVEQRSHELQESENYNKSIISAMSEGLIICTREGIIDTFNPAAEQLYGYGAQEVIGKDIDILVPDKYLEPYGAAFHDYLKNGESNIIQKTNEFRAKRKDGSTFAIEYSISPMQNHGETRYTITVHDISDRKNAEEKLRNNASTLERLHEISTQPSLPLDQKSQRILELGLRHLGLSLGIISHIIDNSYTVIYSAGDDAISPGTEFPLQDTYCSMTLKAHGPIGFHDESTKRKYISREQDKFGLAAYISAPFLVNDQYYGTLNFSSTSARKEAFTAQDFSLLNILAQWIGSEISRDIANKEINRFSNMFESLFRNTPEPIAFASIERKLLMINPAFSKVFGYQPDEIIGKQTAVVYANENAYREQGKIRYNRNAVIAPRPYEIQYRRKNGDIFPAETVSTMLKDSNNETIGFLVHIRDISERKEAEAHLARQAREAMLLHQGTTIASETSSFIETLQNCIDMVCDIMEWPVGTVYVPDEGKNIVISCDILHLDTPDTHQALLNVITHTPLPRNKGLAGKIWKSGTSLWIENIDQDPDLAHLHNIKRSVNTAVGFPVYVDRSIVAILCFYLYGSIKPDNGLLHVLQVLGERVGHVFEKRRAEKAISNAEERARLILESAGEGIYGVDCQGMAIFVNPAAEQMIGYRADELIGKSIHKFIHHSLVDGKPNPEEQNHIHTAFADGQIQRIDNGVIWRKDGSFFPAEYTTMPMWKDGNIVGAVVTFSDITERLRVDKMKSEFVATVSHELRTPLTSIRGSLGLLAGGVAGELPEKAQSMVDIAKKNSDRLLLLINDILDMEKINSGKLEFNFHPTDLTPLINQAIESSQDYAREYGVTFRLIGQPDHLILNIDSDRFIQVMSNLLSNAAKFSPANEYVDISVEVLNQGQVAGHDTPRQIRIAVTDHGPGIPKEFQDRIFEKFSQADASDSRKKGGTGLGLSISKNIIERMNGRIGFITATNKGTTFYVDLPEATGAMHQLAQRRRI